MATCFGNEGTAVKESRKVDDEKDPFDAAFDDMPAASLLEKPIAPKPTKDDDLDLEDMFDMAFPPACAPDDDDHETGETSESEHVAETESDGDASEASGGGRTRASRRGKYLRRVRRG